MQGDLELDSSESGIAPRSFKYIFNHIQQKVEDNPERYTPCFYLFRYLLLDHYSIYSVLKFSRWELIYFAFFYIQREFKCNVSFLEIYKEKISDLLATDKPDQPQAGVCIIYASFKRISRNLV